MDGLTITLGLIGAFTGAAGGAGVALVSTFVSKGILNPQKREKNWKAYAAAGAVVGALGLGSVPALYDAFGGDTSRGSKPAVVVSATSSLRPTLRM